ncbi:ABC transporter substrate-binding protein [Pelagicoccus sp. SDUM812005]|uniref:ABC transporter substrate-binding protein n=1 Tax=Pelagicoccus sp. SDUM812005 TaxID=3041257 RepID=UPI00280F043A|nr:ABC transporter substrate-binding protein [Pelagicoccus sp. SDUM812005]MDQ8180564.1 ABC transporter substrate-binding protein [Pelagicoccus sp. SDUM812005]
MKFARHATRALSALALLATLPFAKAEPLKIGYSDWPGWIAWEIGIKKGWFADAGVEVDFQWMDYVASMDAYVAGQLDAVCMTNGDALAIGGTGKPSVGILINDYSNGNDMLVAAPGISSVKELKGKKIGVEEGFVAHLLALKALESAGLSADDVEWVNVPTNETPQVLASGAVDAIAAWQPNSGQALKTVSGSTPVFTSSDAPGIIYDLLYVSSESLEARKSDWLKVTKVWYQIVEYINDEDNLDEALEILSARVALSPEEYEPFFQGTKILSLRLANKVWEDNNSLRSVYGSSRVVDQFNVDQGVYEANLNIESYLDPSFTKALAE